MELTRETGHKLNNKLYKLKEHMLKNPPPKLSAKILKNVSNQDALQSMFD